MGTIFKSLIGTILGIIISFASIVLLIIGLWLVGVEMLAKESQVTLKRGSVLEINMSEQIVDSPDLNPMTTLRTALLGGAPEISMFDILSALESAAEDPNITAISLRMDGAQSLSLTHAAELRDLLHNFKRKSAKPIYAYAEEYSQSEYYLASVADSLFLHPLGAIEWQGVSIVSHYYGDLFDELGVKVETLRPESNRYKSAVEPYTQSQMSPESREQSSRLADGLWSTILGEVAHSRGVAGEVLSGVAKDQIIVDTQAGVAAGMVDRSLYRDLYDSALEQLGVVSLPEGGVRSVTLGEYASLVRSQREEQSLTLALSSPKVVVIYADGVIVDGDIPTGVRGEVVSAELSQQLRRARLDDDVRAVVLRVNSPGGSAMASDVIAREVALLREVKPVVVSMGSAAASGGYYISAPADAIFANRYSLTGSIGVYGLLFAYEDAMRHHLKITTDGVVSSPSADLGRRPREITPLERAALMRGVEQIYTTFKGVVAKGRDLSPIVVDVLSGGRVWSGEEAQDLALVDGVGGLREAIAYAIDRCDLSPNDVDIVEYNPLVNLFGSGGVVEYFTRMVSGNLLPTTELREVNRLLRSSSPVISESRERVEF